MANLSSLVSELSHALGQPNNQALRGQLRLAILETRNEIIRRSYENHGYVDRGLVQRFKVSLTDVNDGEVQLPEGYGQYLLPIIKRTTHKVPKPIRLTNNLPFDRVSTVGYSNSRQFPFIKETTARFRQHLPGMQCIPCYDYINGYIYIFPANNHLVDVEAIIIESAFEHPTEIQLANKEISEMDSLLDENEFLLSEDMIGQLKEIIFKRDMFSQYRETNEVNNI